MNTVTILLQSTVNTFYTSVSLHIVITTVSKGEGAVSYSLCTADTCSTARVFVYSSKLLNWFLESSYTYRVCIECLLRSLALYVNE